MIFRFSAPRLGLSVILDRLAVYPNCNEDQDDHDHHCESDDQRVIGVVCVEGVLLAETGDDLGSTDRIDVEGVLVGIRICNPIIGY